MDPFELMVHTFIGQAWWLTLTYLLALASAGVLVVRLIRDTTQILPISDGPRDVLSRSAAAALLVGYAIVPVFVTMGVIR